MTAKVKPEQLNAAMDTLLAEGRKRWPEKLLWVAVVNDAGPGCRDFLDLDANAPEGWSPGVKWSRVLLLLLEAGVTRWLMFERVTSEDFK